MYLTQVIQVRDCMRVDSWTNSPTGLRIPGSGALCQYRVLCTLCDGGNKKLSYRRDSARRRYPIDMGVPARHTVYCRQQRQTVGKVYVVCRLMTGSGPAHNTLLCTAPVPHSRFHMRQAGPRNQRWSPLSSLSPAWVVYICGGGKRCKFTLLTMVGI